MVALELEVLSKKMDRFGWDRDRGSASHDRIVTDWMDALQDYPLDEVRAACRAAVLARPNAVPNEGHIVGHILAARKRHCEAYMARQADEPEPPRETISKERAADVLAEHGFAPKRMEG